MTASFRKVLNACNLVRKNLLFLNFKLFLPIIVSILTLLLVVAKVGFFSDEVNAASALPPDFNETLVTSSIIKPTSLDLTPDGRVLLAEQEGRLRVIKDGVLLPNSMLTVNVDSQWERGLLGVTVDPNFPVNQYVYVYYTATTPNVHNRVSRFTVNGDSVVGGSEQILLELTNLGSAKIHNGGAIHFGTDGKLYIAVGDNSQSAKSQLLDNDFGKVLRINSDGTIPSDNPYVGQAGKRPEIYANGFRNPYTFNVNQVTGKIFVNDVGQDTWEEINELVKGANYGWPTCEGTCSVSGMTNPTYTYNHTVGFAVTGGSFYTGTNLPSQYQGDYFFGDYVSGWIKTYDPGTGEVLDFATGADSPIDFDFAPNGDLYYISYNINSIFKISYGGPTPSPTPSPTPPPADQIPTASILTPIEETPYNAGDTVSFWGEGSDPQDGILGNNAFSWTVAFHHDSHTHPFLGPIINTQSGSFEIPTVGETSGNVFYRIYLKVTDSSGYSYETTRDVNLNKSQLTVASQPAGLSLTLEGQPFVAPQTVTSVVGFTRTLGVNGLTQTLGGKTYNFVSWSDAGSTTHNIATPATNTTYTALFAEVPNAQLYISPASSGTIGGVSVANEDILAYNGTAYSMYFDGSDVGLSSFTVGAFDVQNDGSILMSFTSAGTIPGISSTVDDSDIVKFSPTSTGATTVGTFSLYFDGSDVGLSSSSEEIDSVSVLPDGKILISTTGDISVTGVSGVDEDVLAFTPTALGATTTGSYAMYFDGSDVGLSNSSNEDVDSLSIDGSGILYLSTLGTFSVTGVSGNGQDVFKFVPTSLGSTTAGTYQPPLFYDGSVAGLGSINLSSFDLP